MSCFYKCNKYQIKKYEIRQEAIEWQSDGGYHSWAEIIEKENYFNEMGKRYGLLREFRENGIC